MTTDKRSAWKTKDASEVNWRCKRCKCVNVYQSTGLLKPCTIDTTCTNEKCGERNLIEVGAEL